MLSVDVGPDVLLFCSEVVESDYWYRGGWPSLLAVHPFPIRFVRVAHSPQSSKTGRGLSSVWRGVWRGVSSCCGQRHAERALLHLYGGPARWLSQSRHRCGVGQVASSDDPMPV